MKYNIESVDKLISQVRARLVGGIHTKGDGAN